MAVAKQTFGWHRPANWKEDATEVVDVTPELARHILEEYGDFNRPTTEATVTRYASIMIRGEWNLQDTIEFNILGKLVNGYHRLWAVFLSGVTVKFRFRYGAAVQTFATYDVGKNRTGADTIGIGAELINEEVPTADTRLLSSSIPWIVWYESGYASQSFKIDNPFKERFYVERFSETSGENHDDLREGIKIARAAKKVLFGYDAVVLGLYILGSNTPSKKLANREFWKGVATGVGLTEGDPRLVFREKIRHDVVAVRDKFQGKLKQDPVYFNGLKCMRAYFDGRIIERFRPADGITRLSDADDLKYSDPNFVCPHDFGLETEKIVKANREIAAAELGWRTKKK